MLRLDARASGVERTAYLQAWFAAAPARQTLVLEADGAVAGYGTIRACRSGAKVGPLHAADPADAELLLKRARGLRATGRRTHLDIPEPNYAADLARARTRLHPDVRDRPNVPRTGARSRTMRRSSAR